MRLEESSDRGWSTDPSNRLRSVATVAPKRIDPSRWEMARLGVWKGERTYQQGEPECMLGR